MTVLLNNLALWLFSFRMSLDQQFERGENEENLEHKDVVVIVVVIVVPRHQIRQSKLS